MNIIQYLGRGVYHEDNGIPCQDRAKYRYAKNGNIIMAISDGCSSAGFAEEAAQLNVDTLTDFFSSVTLREFLENDSSASDILKPITGLLAKKYTKEYNADPTEFSATLLFAVTDGTNILLGHLGDGNILCTDKNGKTVFFSEEENAGSADRTYFTIAPDAAAHLRLSAVPAHAVANIIMYSDGPQKMLWYRGEKNTESAAAELISMVRNGEITNCAQLADTLSDMTSDSMYQLMDDWSMLILDTSQLQCGDDSAEPLSMKQRFMSNYVPGGVKEKEG